MLQRAFLCKSFFLFLISVRVWWFDSHWLRIVLYCIVLYCIVFFPLFLISLYCSSFIIPPPCNFYFSRFHHFVFETACYCLKIRTQWRLFRDDCRKCGRFSNILILLYLIFVRRKLDLMYILVNVAFKHVVIKKKFISIGKIIMSLFVYVLGRGDIWKSKPRGKKFFL